MVTSNDQMISMQEVGYKGSFGETSWIEVVVLIDIVTAHAVHKGGGGG